MANALSGFNLNQRVEDMYGGNTPAPYSPYPDSWNQYQQAELARQAQASKPGYATSGQMYATAAPVGLPQELQTGIRKVDNITGMKLAAGRPYEEVLKSLDWMVQDEARPMSEGGSKEPSPGILDMILPGAMGLAAGGIGVLNGLSSFGGSVLGAATSGLFSGNPINAGLGVVGAGAMNALGHLRDVNQPKGFSNTDNLYEGNNLKLNLANDTGYVPPTQGVGTGALNYVDSLGRATMNLPGPNFANMPKVSGTNQYPLGGLTPDMLYNPVSMGGPGAKSNIDLPSIKGMGGAPQGAAGGALEEGAAVDPGMGGGVSLSGPTNAGSASQPQGFSDTLVGGAGGGKGPQNALAASGMGAGLIPLSDRDMYRNPGYQPRAFGNYVLR